jgi:SNF2 family DNA or RNA helicase
MARREQGAPLGACGGILADDVGAGKTYIAAGLIIASQPDLPTLVLAPPSLIWQWIQVLKLAGLEICVVRKGAQAHRSAKCNLVVASLGLMATHGARLPPPAFAERTWGRVIIDEAHCAKNPKSHIHTSLCHLHACARWALTATPVQNTPADLLALAKVIGVLGADVTPL